MAIKTLPHQSYLHEALDYDPLTGVLTWKQRPLSHFKDTHAATVWNTHFSGKRAGSLDRGYRILGICNQRSRAARVIWMWMTNKDPGVLEVDHKDRNPTNDAWSNLRLADDSEQTQNRVMGRISKHGFRGVARNSDTKKYRAQVNVNGVPHYFSGFDTPEGAGFVWCKEARRLQGAFYCPPQYELDAEIPPDIDDIYD